MKEKIIRIIKDHSFISIDDGKTIYEIPVIAIQDIADEISNLYIAQITSLMSELIKCYVKEEMEKEKHQEKPILYHNPLNDLLDEIDEERVNFLHKRINHYRNK